jgi:hypothetical protein
VDPAVVPLLKPDGVLDCAPWLSLVFGPVVEPMPVVPGVDGALLVVEFDIPLFCAIPPVPQGRLFRPFICPLMPVFPGVALGVEVPEFDEPGVEVVPPGPEALPLAPAAPPLAPPAPPADCANANPVLPATSAAVSIAIVDRAFAIFCSLGSPPRRNVAWRSTFLAEH